MSANASQGQFSPSTEQSKADGKSENKWPERMFSAALVALAFLTWRIYVRQAKIMNAGHQSLFSIAKKFEDQAFHWADRSFQISSSQVNTHRTVINTLSCYIHYLETYHHGIHRKILPAWIRFSGGDTKRVIDEITYSSHPEWTKDYWINQLFEITDRIREI